ncbi:MAG: hypothetical protein AB7U35_06940, partial [Sphingobium sp.]
DLCHPSVKLMLANGGNEGYQAPQQRQGGGASDQWGRTPNLLKKPVETGIAAQKWPEQVPPRIGSVTRV